MSNEPPVEQIGYAQPPSTLPPDGPNEAPYSAPPFPAGHGERWGVIGADDVADASSRRIRWGWAPRSLTSRLVVGVVSLVIVLVLATGIGTYYALRSFLINRLDQQVDAAATPTQIVDLFQGRPNSSQIGVRSPQKVWAIALSSDGAQVFPPPSGSLVETMQLDESSRESLAAARTVTRSITTQDGQNLRITTRRVEVQNRITGASAELIAVIGLSTGEVNRTLDRLIELELIIGLTAIVLAFGATAYGVKYSLRRLHGVTRTAQEVAAELSPTGAGLERRVEVAEPETEVGQLATSMNTLLSAVETQFAERVASENRMRQFLADASHELRTPLTSIRGYAELSRMQGRGDQDSLARIEAEGTRMSRLVDDLLTLARTDQGGERAYEALDIGEVLSDAVDGVRAAHPERRIEVTAEHGLAVTGDRDQLVRVVRNLATNAAVHTRPDGVIRVSGSHEGAFVVVRVSDEGPGLPPDEAAHVFERFWRADKARTRAQGGSGLGMSIVAALVQEHNGYVQFESSVAGGSTVTVRLPRRPAT